MRFVVRLCIITVYCLSIALPALTQTKKITGQFNKVPFPAFVKQVEAESVYHFYYDSNALDSFVLNITLKYQILPPPEQEEMFPQESIRFRPPIGVYSNRTRP